MDLENPVRRTYTRQERLEPACLRVAVHIRELWEETGHSDTRLLEGLFLPDDLTLAGDSHNYTKEGKGRREHVVPRLVIIKECLAKIENGESDQVIADFIRSHVKIVRISKEEQERLDNRSLDSRSKTTLRQTMPSDWVIGGDIYARLTAAEIRWVPKISE